MLLTLQIILILTSLLLVTLILLQRGKGGGLTDLFGGGMTASVSGSAAADPNVRKYTIFVALIWLIAVIGNGLLVSTG